MLLFRQLNLLYRIGNNEVVVRVCEVLNGYPSLVKEFNSFLPQGYILEPSSPTKGHEAFITLNTPEGVTVFPRDYPRAPSSAPPRFRKDYYDYEVCAHDTDPNSRRI